MEIDFTALNEALNSQAECKTENCDRRVADEDTFCMGCFVGLISGETERIGEIGDGKPFRYVRKESE
jgi:hypothetical protein